jgi:hypothetical protein
MSETIIHELTKANALLSDHYAKSCDKNCSACTYGSNSLCVAMRDMTTEQRNAYLLSDFKDTAPKMLTDAEKTELNYVLQIRSMISMSYHRDHWIALDAAGCVFDLAEQYMDFYQDQIYDIVTVLQNAKSEIRFVDYLQFRSIHSFNSEILNGSDVEYEIQIAGIDSEANLNQRCIIGTRDTASTNKNMVLFYTDGIGFNLGLKSEKVALPLSSQVGHTMTYRLVDLKPGVKIDEGAWTEYDPINAAAFNSAYKLLIGGLLTGSTGVESGYMNAKLNYCKIWKADSLVRDLHPAIDQNNVYCLYDNVGRVYLYPNKEITGGNY